MVLLHNQLIIPHRLIERERVNEDDRNSSALVAIVNADPIYFYQHLAKVLQTQENCKIRFKPLLPRN